MRKKQPKKVKHKIRCICCNKKAIFDIDFLIKLPTWKMYSCDNEQYFTCSDKCLAEVNQKNKE